MIIVGMVNLALKRLRSRLGLTVLSLLGVILAVGLVTSIPIFTQAVSYLVLRGELQTLSRLAGRPPFAVRFYFLASPSQPLSLATADRLQETISRLLIEKVGLPIKQAVTTIETAPLTMRATPDNRHFPKNADNLRQVTLDVISSVDRHIVVEEGEPFGETWKNGRLGVWVQQALADAMGLQVGEEYDLAPQGQGPAISIYIAGFWQAHDAHESYWYNNPETSMSEVLLVPRSLFESAVQPLLAEQTGFDSWYFVLDEQSLAMTRVDASADGLQKTINALGSILPGLKMDYSPLDPLHRYTQRRATLSALLVGFSLPAMGLLLYFLALLSSTTVLFRREETAILASRGAGSGYILGVFGIETLLLVAVGVPLGMALGGSLAFLMGYTLSFLDFIARPPLPISLTAVDGRLLTAAILMLLAARLVPAWRASQTSIVGALRERSRQVTGSFTSRLAVDIPLIVVSLYAYLHLKQRGTLGIIGWEPSGDPFKDPLLLLAPSLFIFTACLVLAHLFPLFLRPLDALGGRLPYFPGYMGLRHLMRQSEQYTSALFLVLVCMSLGAFYSSLALSLDQWLQDRIYYRVGADYVFKQGVKVAPSGGPGASGGSAQSETEGGWLLPAGAYLEIPGVVAATRVGDFDATALQPRQNRGRFLGIDRLDFPTVAFFRPDFANDSLGELMNRLGMYPNGILVSQQFLKTNNLQTGQRLDLDINTGTATQKVGFVIVGTFNYFPTMYPQKGDVFVGNLDYLFDQFGGAFRHSIWLRIEPSADVAAIRRQIQDMGIEITNEADARLDIVQDQDRVERIGLFGVLSIGFLAGTVLSGVGLLVYIYASLQGRLGQFSVLRAIGSQLADILTMVAIEYAGVMSYGVLTGVTIGVLSSYLFVPFFQFSSDPGTALPPFLLQIAWGKTAAIAITFAVVLVLSQLIILYRLTRREFFQMLRMGQHQ